MKKLLIILLIFICIKSVGQAGVPQQHQRPPVKYLPLVLLKPNKNGTKVLDTVFRFWLSANMHVGQTGTSITNTGSLSTTFSGGASLGGDVQLAYFFGRSAVVGVTAGLSYSSFSGKLTEDVYNETIYNAMTDNANPNRPSRPFTQIISLTGDPVVENVNLQWLSLPVTAAWKGYFTPRVGFQVEAGAVYTLHYAGTMSSTHALFDYEAIYSYDATGRYLPATGNPNVNQSFNITKAMAAKYNMTGDQYLAYMGSAAGGSYPVGTGIQPLTVNSNATFSSGNIGLLLRAGISWYASPVFFINATAFFQASSFNNNNTAGYQLINEKKYYNTLLNGISSMRNNIAGIRIGVSHALFYKVSKVKK